MIDDIFWLMKAYIEAYNDKQSIIVQFQIFLKRQIFPLSNEHVNILMNIYGKIGNIDHQIYDCYIRPYLLERLESSVDDMIKYMQFVVYSEASDDELVNILLKNLTKKDKDSDIDDLQLHKIHILVHYFRIKGVNFQLGR